MDFQKLAALVAVVALAVLVGRLLAARKMERRRWRIKTGHSWFTRMACAVSVHLRGRPGLGCLYNATVCRHCGQDVMFVLKDESRGRK